MKLEKVINQLNEDNYNLLLEQFEKTNANKFQTMLVCYRGNNISEEEIQNRLKISPSAYYTLRSRLYDKIQEFLFYNTSDTRIELLQNVANIEHLVYKTPRETAIGILKKLESKLIENDMPNELISVYQALKKLHVNSPKYYDYEQLYNKNIAFYLAQQKAEDILSAFCKTLSEYYVSRRKELMELLVLYKKEMYNTHLLYNSHHLTIYENILNIHFELFVEEKDEKTVEEMLYSSISIIEANKEDKHYKNISIVFDFLYFEYYLQYKLYKNATRYYDKINDNIETLLTSNHTCFAYKFLLSRVQWQFVVNKRIQFAENEIVEPENNDSASKILFYQYIAANKFYQKRYPEAIQSLCHLINEISFKEFPYAEIEIKLFLALLYVIEYCPEEADITMRSISRKITDDANYQKSKNALNFLKILKIAHSNKIKRKLDKIKDHYQIYSALNNGQSQILEFLKFDEKFIKLLASLNNKNYLPTKSLKPLP